MNRLKIVEDFLNSLESEQMQEGQDAMLFNGTADSQLGGLTSNASRCINSSSNCNGSINDSRCSNAGCSDSINGRKCTTITTPPPPGPTQSPVETA